MKYNRFSYLFVITAAPFLLGNEPITCISVVNMFVVLPLYIISYNIIILSMQMFWPLEYINIQYRRVEKNWKGNADVVLILYIPWCLQRYGHLKTVFNIKKWFLCYLDSSQIMLLRL